MTNERRRVELVQPFYLKMMAGNAAENGSALVPAIIRAASGYSATDVVGLLGIAWREKVMGAWLALLYDEPEVTAAVLAALESSQGSLDAPPLATAATVLAGKGALPSLAEYAARDVAAGWGACGFAAAAIDHLGGTISSCVAEDGDRRSFVDLLGVAGELRAARSRPWPPTP